MVSPEELFFSLTSPGPHTGSRGSPSMKSISELQRVALALIHCEQSVSLPFARLMLSLQMKKISMPRKRALSAMKPALADLERARGPLATAWPISGISLWYRLLVPGRLVARTKSSAGLKKDDTLVWFHFPFSTSAGWAAPSPALNSFNSEIQFSSESEYKNKSINK